MKKHVDPKRLLCRIPINMLRHLLLDTNDKKMINVSLQRACQIMKALQGHTTHLYDVRSKQSSHSRKADDSEVRTLATKESSSFSSYPTPARICVWSLC